MKRPASRVGAGCGSFASYIEAICKLYCSGDDRRINRDARVHRGGDGRLGDVAALHGGRLQTLDFVGNSLEVLVESLLGEGELADEEAQVAILVNTEVDLAALDVLDDY